MNAKEARAAGCTFYSLPGEGMDRDGIDPAILPVCDAINSSGICWTAESCAGHPDAREPRWADNVEPMVRLVYPAEHEGRVFSALLSACRSMEVPSGDEEGMTPWGRPQAAGLKVHPCCNGQPEWCETLVYVYASTTWSRDRGIEALRRFAENLGRG